MKVHKAFLANQRGMTLVELMVTMVISLIILGGTIYVFVNQQSLLKDQNDNTKVRAKGRLAIKLLAREIRMAGFGMPPSSGITDISTANSISYRTNLDNVRTFLDSTKTGATLGDNSVSVLDGSSFNNADNIVIYNPAYGDSDYVTVTSGTSGEINFAEALNHNYQFGENARVVYVNKYNNITIAYAGERITKQWDGGPVVPIMNEIAATGMEFEYYDAAGNVTTNLADIRKIAITLSMLDPKNPDANIEFKTDVRVRNSSAKT